MNKMLATLLCLAPLSAFAAPITGTISLDGQDTYTSTRINFMGNGNVGPGTATGSFSPAFSVGCVGCAALTSFDYVGFTAPVTVYSAVIGATTTAFTITSIAFEHQAGAFLDISALGYATLIGFDQTPGTFELSSQGGKNKAVTFSATEIATPNRVPEPLSVAMLGSALVGLGMIRRKR